MSEWINRLLSRLFPYSLPDKLTAMLVAEGMIRENPSTGFHP